MATVAQTLIDLHINSLKAFDREIAGLIERAVAPGAGTTLPRCDYEATRQQLYSGFVTGPLPEPIEYKPMSYPATTRGSYTAQGSIVVNYDVLREMQMSSGIAFGPFPSLKEIDAENDHPPYPRWEIRSPTGQIAYGKCYTALNRIDFFAGPNEATVPIHSTALNTFDNKSQARLLDRHGKPTERKHITLTTGAAASPSIKVTDVGMATTVVHDGTATAAEVVAAVKASGSRYADKISLPSKPLPTKEEMAAAVDALITEFNRHAYSVAMPVDPVTGHVVGPLPVPGTRENPVKVESAVSTREKISDALRRQTEPGSSYAAAKTHSDVVAAKMRQAATKEQWRDFPTVEEVRAAPFTVWAIQRPDGSVFYGYFVVAEEYIYLQQCTDKGIFLKGTFSDPFRVLHGLKARPVVEEQTDIKCNTLVRIVVVQSDLDALDRGTVIETLRSTVGEPLCTVRSDDRKRSVTVPLRDLTFEYKNFAAKIAAQVERKAAEAAEAANNPVFTVSQTSNGWKITDVAYTTAHDVAEVRGTSDRPLGGVLQQKEAEVVYNYKVGDVVCTFEDVIHGCTVPWIVTAVQGDAVSCKLYKEERFVTLPAKEWRILLTDKGTPTTISELEQQGATMPSTDTAKPTTRLRRAITEATRRAPVELGLNQAHEAIVKQAARKFKGTAAEKKVVARFLSDLLGSEYGKAGLAAALATVIPQLAPLLGKHEGKAETLAEELATRSATILAVKAGSDLISLLGPLTAILSDMISSAETPQITAGTGRSALDEIGDVATTVRSV